MGDFTSDLAVALSLADSADTITQARFGSTDLHITTKPDLTPVSDADLAVENILRSRLSVERPQDDILGEELGGTPSFSGRQWVIDPIDSTKNFVRGLPIWATLISLLVDGIPRLGVVSAPALGRRWWASEAEGAFSSVTRSLIGASGLMDTRANDNELDTITSPIHVSGVSLLADASVSLSSLGGWKDRGLLDQIVSLTDHTWRLRGYGDFLSYCFVAEGTVDIAAEPEVSLWDLAALDILVREAGGRFTSLSGIPGPHGGDALATNGLLHDCVKEAIL